MMMMFYRARPGAFEILREAEAGTGGGDAAATGTPGEGGAEAPAAAAGQWFEDQRLTEDHRSYLTAKGLTTAADPTDAVTKLIGIGQAADRRFGRGIDSVIDKPAQGQDLTEWRKANAEVFGIPAAADGYEITRPEGMPEGIAWNDDLVGRMRSLAFERGMAPGDVQALTEMYAGYVTEIENGVDADMRAAEKQLDGELVKLWGRDVEANKARARQAASALAEAAGIDQAGLESVVGLLSNGAPGQTAALRMFAALGEMMGEDKAIGIKAGVGQLGMTKAEAQQALSTFVAPDGEWAKASAAGDTEAIARLRPQYERLTRQIAAGK